MRKRTSRTIVLAAASEAGFAPDRLTLEITEQALVTDLETSAAQLDLLARRGMRIALDDFGAGFCNFRYLKRLPIAPAQARPNAWSQGIADDERDLAVLRGILAMARALGLKVVAEGVETEAQRASSSAKVARSGRDFSAGCR